MTAAALGGPRRRALRGGSVLLVRQVLGAALAFAGMLALARLLGPAENGLYFTAFGIVFFVQNLAKLGLDTFLVRLPGPLDEATLDQIFVLLAVLGPPRPSPRRGQRRRRPALAMPDLQGPSRPRRLDPADAPLPRPLSRLERDLAFGASASSSSRPRRCSSPSRSPRPCRVGRLRPRRRMVRPAGALLAACFAASGYRPGFALAPRAAREALAYGCSHHRPILIQSLRPLIVPLLVGGTQGPPRSASSPSPSACSRP